MKRRMSLAGCGLAGVLGAAIVPVQSAESTPGEPPLAQFVLSPAVSDEAITVSIDHDGADIQGWSLGLCHDPDAARLVEFAGTEELLQIRGGAAPSFYVCELASFPAGSSPARSGVVQAVVLSYYETLFLPVRDGGFPVLEARYDVLAESSLDICDGLQGKGQPVLSAFTLKGVTYKPETLESAALVQKPYAGKLRYEVEPAESSEVVTVKLSSEEVLVEGWSFALCHTADSADVVEVKTSPEVERLVNGEAPEFVRNDVLSADPFVAVTQAVLLSSSSEPISLGPFPDGLPLLGIRYAVRSKDAIKFCDQVGSITFDNHVMIDGIGYVPRTRLGGSLVTGALGARFLRGDANLDGVLNLSDPVFTLMALFLGGGPLPCLDAADANDVARVDISDPIFTLRYLFTGGPAPPAPFPQPGEELSPATALGCDRGL